MTTKWYGLGMEFVVEQPLDFLPDTIKVAMTTSSYTPNQDTHNYFDDITNEVSGTGYTAGGKTLASKTVTYDAASQRVWLNAADVEWTTATITNARYAVIYKSTGVAATSPLLAYIDFGANKSSSAASFELQFAADDILYIDVT